MVLALANNRGDKDDIVYYIFVSMLHDIIIIIILNNMKGSQCGKFIPPSPKAVDVTQFRRGFDTFIRWCINNYILYLYNLKSLRANFLGEKGIDIFRLLWPATRFPMTSVFNNYNSSFKPGWKQEIFSFSNRCHRCLSAGLGAWRGGISLLKISLDRILT